MKSKEPFNGKFPDWPGTGNIFEWVVEKAQELRRQQTPAPVPVPSLGRRL